MNIFRGIRERRAKRWEEGRPQRRPTLALRIRGRAFDVYCEAPTDVTLDGIGIPVVNGHTVGRVDLRRGWFVDQPTAV